MQTAPETDMMDLHYQATADGFAEAARTFDEDEEGNILLLWMRERSARLMNQAFAPGGMLLELGCGTGIEASRLVAAGHRIVLTDVSAGMLERAVPKVSAVREKGLVGAHQMPAAQIGTLVDRYGRAAFDGAYSSFGPLNCEPDPVPVAQGLAELIRPGGRVVLSVINRICPAEVLWYALHLMPGTATRRLRGPALSSAVPGAAPSFLTYYYSPSDFTRAFSGSFRVLGCRALPLILPPPYTAHVMRRFPRLFHLLGRLDDALAALPVLRSMGDHFLMELERM
ncbi:MAG TPA: methyltransferase domain-containing protein [Candidatus Kapabacteria bacterium]|nr:methyltransferase domain-containing protein [Candidatus Kapabacteria bacterium]